MKKNSIITIITMIFTLAVGLTWLWIDNVQGAVDTGNNYDFPISNSSFDGHTFLYYKVFDCTTGEILDVSMNDGAGGFSLATTWANSAVTNGISWNSTHKAGFVRLPEILKNRKYLIRFYGSADTTPDASDTHIDDVVISWSGNSIIGWPVSF